MTNNMAEVDSPLLQLDLKQYKGKHSIVNKFPCSV